MKKKALYLAILAVVPQHGSTQLPPPTCDFPFQLVNDGVDGGTAITATYDARTKTFQFTGSDRVFCSGFE